MQDKDCIIRRNEKYELEGITEDMIEIIKILNTNSNKYK